MKKIKVGIIGMGYIGESHIEAVRRIGMCELAAVADTNAALAHKKAEQYGIAKCYSTVDELLRDPDIDAVHNCTPNFLHYDINSKILASGKHLLSEKPLCGNYAEADKLVQLKKRYPDSVAAVNFNYRLNPMVSEMKARIERGELGDVRIISGQYQQDWLMFDTDYSWRLEPEIAGNSCAIADIGSHWMDIVQYVTGHRIVSLTADVRTVIPVRKKPSKQTETFSDSKAAEYEEVQVKNEEYGAVIFRTDKGASGVFHVSELAAGRGCYLGFEINGSKLSYGWNQEQNDRMWIGRRGGDNSTVIRNPNALSPEYKAYTSLAMGHPEGWNDAFKGNILSFYKRIAEGAGAAAPFATLEQAAYVVKLTEAVIESGKNRKWVDVNV